MKGLGFLILVCGLLACGGEKKDDLGPYVTKLVEITHYAETLKQNKEYLSTAGMTTKANNTEQVIKDFLADLEAYPELEDKHVRALHNELKRTLQGSLRKIVQPDFPTFVPNASRAINMVLDELVVIHVNLEKLWVKDGKTEAFPLKWNKEE